MLKSGAEYLVNRVKALLDAALVVHIFQGWAKGFKFEGKAGIFQFGGINPLASD